MLECPQLMQWKLLSYKKLLTCCYQVRLLFGRLLVFYESVSVMCLTGHVLEVCKCCVGHTWSSGVSPVVLVRGKLCVCFPLSFRIRVQTLCVSLYELTDVGKAHQPSLFASQRTRFSRAFARLKDIRLWGILEGCPMPFSGPPTQAYSPHFTKGCIGLRGEPEASGMDFPVVSGVCAVMSWVASSTCKYVMDV